MPFDIGTLTAERCHLKAFQDVAREDFDDYGWVIESPFIVPTRCEILVQMDDGVRVNVASLGYPHDGTYSNLPNAKPLLG